MFEGIYTEQERAAKISKELKRLSQSLGDLTEHRRTIFKRLINEAAFIGVTLEEARLIIMRDGIVEEYRNGANQSGLKKSSVVEVYDKYISSYMKIIDQINKCLPETAQIKPGGIMDYALGRK